MIGKVYKFKVNFKNKFCKNKFSNNNLLLQPNVNMRLENGNN